MKRKVCIIDCFLCLAETKRIPTAFFLEASIVKGLVDIHYISDVLATKKSRNL